MGVLAGMGGAAKRGLNRVSASWLDAADQSIFFGARAQRETIVGGAKEMKDAMRMRKLSAEQMRTNVQTHKTALEAHRPKAGASQEALREFSERESATRQMIKNERDKHNEVLGLVGGTAMDTAVDTGKAIGGYYSAADRAGQGIARRGGAIATRAGMTLGASMAVGTGVRYATGGTFTENRNGERDIAGVPFL